MHWGTGYKGFYKKRFRIIGSKNEILVVFCGVNKINCFIDSFFNDVNVINLLR